MKKRKPVTKVRASRRKGDVPLYLFLGYTAFGMGIISLNPMMCCGIYGDPFFHFIAAAVLLLTGAGYVATYH